MARTPTQAELLAQNRVAIAAAAVRKKKRRYQNVIGLGLGGAGFAAALCGLPVMLSVLLWGAGAASWAILKRV